MRFAADPDLICQIDSGAVGQVQVRRGIEGENVGASAHGEFADIGPAQGAGTS
jgi:hypothetical protein